MNPRDVAHAIKGPGVQEPYVSSTCNSGSWSLVSLICISGSRNPGSQTHTSFGHGNPVYGTKKSRRLVQLFNTPIRRAPGRRSYTSAAHLISLSLIFIVPFNKAPIHTGHTLARSMITIMLSSSSSDQSLQYLFLLLWCPITVPMSRYLTVNY